MERCGTSLRTLKTNYCGVKSLGNPSGCGGGYCQIDKCAQKSDGYVHSLRKGLCKNLCCIKKAGLKCQGVSMNNTPPRSRSVTLSMYQHSGCYYQAVCTACLYNCILSVLHTQTLSGIFVVNLNLAVRRMLHFINEICAIEICLGKDTLTQTSLYRILILPF